MVALNALKTVLVVEDDIDIREALSQVLEFEGYQVVSAVNGREAIEYLKRSAEKPALILLDLMMPVMDGWQFRGEQQRDPTLSRIPVVVVSADGRASQKAAAIGAAGFLTKPVELDMLLNTVARHCRA